MTNVTLSHWLSCDQNTFLEEAKSFNSCFIWNLFVINQKDCSKTIRDHGWLVLNVVFCVDLIMNKELKHYQIIKCGQEIKKLGLG